ncbi:hypothetical protein EYF80_022885 [Liparis tanakae]|uniref:Uncharacterized protein n=1 Tax=Liparis tanakae TaxID=230148 RepID=A0A4Z2HLV4_9TELE|nr:hypothetical protein EYF80_022885 [Liparis tanakae]
MDHWWAPYFAGHGADFDGAPQPPPPPPPPPGAALGIDYGAGGDYAGAPGPPRAARLVQEGNVGQIEFNMAYVALLLVLERMPPDEARLRLIRLRLARRMARVLPRRGRRGQARR